MLQSSMLILVISIFIIFIIFFNLHNFNLLSFVLILVDENVTLMNIYHINVERFQPVGIGI